MSRFFETTVECPECNNSSSFRIWESINTALDPEMKEKVKDRSAFIFTCPKCGGQTAVDYGFLYHQMEDRIMIAYSNSDENEEELYHLFTEEQDDIFGVGNLFLKDEYLLRIVRSLNALREKIYIFDDGLDDRIIEIYKLFLYVRLREDSSEPEDIDIFYLGGEVPRFEAVTSSKFVGAYDFNKDFYDALVMEYGGPIPELRHDDPIVDRYYAMKLLESKKNEKQC